MPPQQEEEVAIDSVPDGPLLASADHHQDNNNDQGDYEQRVEEKNDKNSTTTTTTYNVGDHVYTWVSYMGVPFATQEHGVVVDLEETHIQLVRFEKEESKDRDDDADDTRVFRMVKDRISLEDANNSWHKIPYGVHWMKRMLTRAGTANPLKADDSSLVLRRVGFLWKNQSSLLTNLALLTSEKDISECIAVWCMTGNFYSYHGLAKLGHHGADMGSGATLAGGVCVQAAVSAVVPIMLPVFAVYDVASTLQSVKESHKCKQEWTTITKDWNEKFSMAKHLQESERISSIASLYSPPKSLFSSTPHI